MPTTEITEATKSRYATFRVNPRAATGSMQRIEGDPLLDPASRRTNEGGSAMRDSSTVTIDLSLGNGPGEAQPWPRDLTVHDVEFNSENTT